MRTQEDCSRCCNIRMHGIAKSAKGNCKDAENKLHQTLCNYLDLEDGVDIGDDTRVWIFPCKAV